MLDRFLRSILIVAMLSLALGTVDLSRPERADALVLVDDAAAIAILATVGLILGTYAASPSFRDACNEAGVSIAQGAVIDKAVRVWARACGTADAATIMGAAGYKGMKAAARYLQANGGMAAVDRAITRAYVAGSMAFVELTDLMGSMGVAADPAGMPETDIQYELRAIPSGWSGVAALSGLSAYQVNSSINTAGLSAQSAEMLQFLFASVGGTWSPVNVQAQTLRLVSAGRYSWTVQTSQGMTAICGFGVHTLPQSINPIWISDTGSIWGTSYDTASLEALMVSWRNHLNTTHPGWATGLPPVATFPTTQALPLTAAGVVPNYGTVYPDMLGDDALPATGEAADGYVGDVAGTLNPGGDMMPPWLPPITTDWGLTGDLTGGLGGVSDWLDSYIDGIESSVDGWADGLPAGFGNVIRALIAPLLGILVAAKAIVGFLASVFSMLETFLFRLFNPNGKQLQIDFEPRYKSLKDKLLRLWPFALIGIAAVVVEVVADADGEQYPLVVTVPIATETYTFDVGAALEPLEPYRGFLVALVAYWFLVSLVRLFKPSVSV